MTQNEGKQPLADEGKPAAESAEAPSEGGNGTQSPAARGDGRSPVSRSPAGSKASDWLNVHIRIRDPELIDALCESYGTLRQTGLTKTAFLQGLIRDGISYRSMDSDANDLAMAAKSIRRDLDDRLAGLREDLVDLVAGTAGESEKCRKEDAERQIRATGAVYAMLATLMRGGTLSRADLAAGTVGAVPGWMSPKPIGDGGKEGSDDGK